MGKLIKAIDTVKPQIMTINYIEDKYTYVSINLNICLLTDGTFAYDKIELPDWALNNIHEADDETKYSVLIVHIINAYYNEHQMTAILSNYMVEPDNEKYVKEFNDMQKIRKLAKDTANEIITNKLF